ncbi:MAG: DUF4097 family beta strand repeat-containing protein [bacterium]|jgi:DUF4097 and DUF4098 domain-containing protein YvlB
MRMLTLIVAVLMLAVPVRSDTDLERSFDVESGQTLTVELDTGGDISITGWDKQVVDVKVIYHEKDKERIEVDMRRVGSGVDISSDIEIGWGDTYRYAPDLEIMVPLKFNLDLHTMGGEIEIDNVEGEISGMTMGGDLDLKYLKGDIALKTMGGDITCRDSDLDGSVSTMGGKVLMRNLVGNVKGSSMGGHVIYENVTSRDGKTTGDVVNITTMGGDINVNVAPKGAKVSTMGGDIEIRSAGEFVKAKTMGGDIEIGEVDGWVKATTMAGNIEITMVGDPDKGDRSVTLTSMSGDIELTVPAGLSMELDIELAYTKGNEGDFDIHSDFDFEREETKEWDRDNGSPRKYIYGKGSVKGGKHRIRIKTINGDIYLNRGK